MKITKVGERVLEINGRKVVFDQPIDEFLVLEDRVIIMFEPPDELEDDPESGRNVLLTMRPASSFGASRIRGLPLPA